MDLRDRLKAMGVRPRVPSSPAPSPQGTGESTIAVDNLTVNGLSSTVHQTTIRFSQTAFRIDQALSGKWHDTADGPCFAVEKRFPIDHVRGPVHLGMVLHTRPSTLWDAGRASSLRDIDARRLLFLDTETTGLSGGTGTYVFLVGVAFFSESGDEVVLRQYFLSDVSAERALLHALNDLFRDFTAVVT